MTGPMSWLNDYTDISGVTPKEYNDALTMSGSKVEGIETTYFDLDENYVYFYKTVNSKKYLHRVSLNATYVEDETNDQMIGVYLDGDAPEIEEKEE